MGYPEQSDLPHYTYDDYILWEGQWEIINGIAYAMTPSPVIEHQRISQNIAQHLGEVLEDCTHCIPLLPIDWKINEDTIVQPDNLVVCHKVDGTHISKAPILIFEILSKSTAIKDQGVKYRLYESEGVQYYIIVDPMDKVAKIYDLSNGKYIKRMDVTDEATDFSLGDCLITLDFSKIFK
jgi:Uma2 family endonuclease